MQNPYPAQPAPNPQFPPAAPAQAQQYNAYNNPAYPQQVGNNAQFFFLTLVCSLKRNSIMERLPLQHNLLLQLLRAANNTDNGLKRGLTKPR